MGSLMSFSLGFGYERRSFRLPKKTKGKVYAILFAFTWLKIRMLGKPNLILSVYGIKKIITATIRCRTAEVINLVGAGT